MWTRPQSLIAFFIFIELVKKVSNDGRRRNPFAPRSLQRSHFTCDDVTVIYNRLFILRSFMFIITTYNEKYQAPFDIQNFFG